MTEQKTPLDQALDLFVYAPLGLLLNADEVVPQLVARGKQQIAMAKMIGPFAVQQGQTVASEQMGKLQTQALSLLAGLEKLRRPAASKATPTRTATALAPPAAPSPAASSAPDVAPSARAARPVPARGATARPSTTRSTPSPTTASLAIPDYDSLSASQVVPRLEGLSPAELKKVEAYETAHRGRKTILSKIAQLRG